MDKLQWFKFSHTDWMMGKIQRCDEITQARFIRLCCLYWNKETNLSEEDARIEIDDSHFDVLLNKKIIGSDGSSINIDFLDEQFDKILKTSKQASEAGKASAEKRRLKAQQLLNDRSTTVQRNPTDKIRGDKKREEKKREEYYIEFDHLKLSVTDHKRLLVKYSTEQIDDILDRIANYKKNTSYKSLYLTARNWLAKEYPDQETKEEKAKNFINNF